jgi:hypothetical protein
LSELFSSIDSADILINRIVKNEACSFGWCLMAGAGLL